MGACTFDHIGFGKTVEDALKQAKADAYDEAIANGEGTNGTVDTVDTIRPLPLEGSMTDKKIDAWLEEAWQKTDKREACYIELRGAMARRYSKFAGRKRGDKVFLFAGWAHE